MNPLLARIERLEAKANQRCAFIIVPPDLWADAVTRRAYIAAERAKLLAWQSVIAVDTGVPPRAVPEAA